MADRSYSFSFNQNKSNPVFMYIEDPDGLDGSGNWRPARTTDFAGGGGGGGSGTTDMAPTNRILVSGAKSDAAASVVYSNGYVSSLLGKSGPGEIHSVFGYNSGIAQFMLMYNGTNSAGTLIGVIGVPSGNNFSVDYSAHGAAVSAGIFVAFSSSPGSVVATNNDALVTIVYK